jgi:hypothetical protein
VPNVHQLAPFWPQIFGALAVIANLAIGIRIKHEPKAQVPLTLAAVAITVLAATMLFQSPRHRAAAPGATPNTVFYPSPEKPARANAAAIEYRKL